MKIRKLPVVLLSILFAGLGLQAQSTITNGLISFYPFIGNAVDVVGSENGTVENAYLTTNMFGAASNAYLFRSQSNSVITVPATTVNNLTNGTIAAWVELDSNTQGMLFGKQQSGENTMVFFSVGYAFSAGPGPITPGQLYFHAYNGAPDVYSSTYLSTNEWYYVAVTFSPTNCCLYINGNISTNVPGDFSIPDYPGATETSIGSWLFDVNQISLNGRMTRVRVYNRTLSTNDMAVLYAAEFPLQFTQNLTNLAVVYGQNTNISVAVSGTAPINYQWHFLPAANNGQAGAYSELAGSFVYNVVVTNGGFGYGNIPGVSFTGGGGSGAGAYASVSNGTIISITMTNAGTGYSTPPTVVISPPDGTLLGQTNSTLAITNANLGSLGTYYVVVTNAVASLTSTMVDLALLYPPTITTNPVGTVQNYDTSLTLNVFATGTSPLSYQWWLNSTNIPGATNSSYSIASLNLANAGAYTAEVINPYGTVYSDPANVYVAPTLTAPFMGADELTGDNTTLAVGAVGSGMLSYQWYFNGAAIAGATSSTYVLDDIQLTNTGLYDVVISSPYGSATNTAYEVEVSNPANISIGLFPGIYITGTTGFSYTIQSSTNLSNTNGWVTATNIMLLTSPYIWVDTSVDTTQPGHPVKFYRAVGEQ